MKSLYRTILGVFAATLIAVVAAPVTSMANPERVCQDKGCTWVRQDPMLGYCKCTPKIDFKRCLGPKCYKFRPVRFLGSK